MSHAAAKPNPSPAPADPLPADVQAALARVLALAANPADADLERRRAAIVRAHEEAKAGVVAAGAAVHAAREAHVDHLARGVRDREGDRALDVAQEALRRAERQALLAAEVVDRVETEYESQRRERREHGHGVAWQSLEIILPALQAKLNEAARLHQAVMEIAKLGIQLQLGLPGVSFSAFTHSKRNGNFHVHRVWTARLTEAGFNLAPAVDGAPRPAAAPDGPKTTRPPRDPFPRPVIYSGHSGGFWKK